MDDAAGLLAAERLRALGIPAKSVSGEASGLVEAWNDADDVILVDTVVGSGPAGSIHRWDTEQCLPLPGSPSSTHGLGVAEAIELARALGRLPRRLRVYGIEGRQFNFGTDLSPELPPAIDSVVEEIAREMNAKA